jgi:phosphatidylglycerol:prolipoprotein diacylglycerol transferase
MYPTLVHLYGPFSINSYGTAILIGVLIFLWMTSRTSLGKQLIKQDHFYNLILVNILTGVIGGRLLFVLSEWKTFTHWTEWLTLWDGGFSILGTLLGIILTTTLYLKINKLPLLATFDLFALNAGFMQGFGRLGCFFAGCCYGIKTSSWWSITFTHPQGLAPLCVKLVPTQLISATFFFLLVLLMHSFKEIFKRPGQLVSLYLVGSSLERFFLDFWRADRIIDHHNFSPFIIKSFSLHQWISLMMASVALLLFFISTFSFSSRKN